MKRCIALRVLLWYMILVPLSSMSGEKRKRSPGLSSEEERPQKRIKRETSVQETPQGMEEELAFIFEFDDNKERKISGLEDIELLLQLETIKNLVEGVGGESPAGEMRIPLIEISSITFDNVLKVLHERVNFEKLSEQNLVGLIKALNYLGASDHDLKKACIAYVAYIKKHGITVYDPFPADIDKKITPYIIGPTSLYIYKLFSNTALLHISEIISTVLPRIYKIPKGLLTIYAGDADHLFSIITESQQAKQLITYNTPDTATSMPIPHFFMDISADGMLIVNHNFNVKKAVVIDGKTQKTYPVDCDDCYLIKAFKHNGELYLFSIYAYYKKSVSYECVVSKFDAQGVRHEVWRRNQGTLIKLISPCTDIFFDTEGTVAGLVVRGKTKNMDSKIVFIDLDLQSTKKAKKPKVLKKIDISRTLMRPSGHPCYPRLMVYEWSGSSKLAVNIGFCGNGFFDNYNSFLLPRNTEPMTKTDASIIAPNDYAGNANQKVFFNSIASFINFSIQKSELYTHITNQHLLLAPFLPWLTTDVAKVLYQRDNIQFPTPYAVVNQEQGYLFLVNKDYDTIAMYSLFNVEAKNMFKNITVEEAFVLNKAYEYKMEGKPFMASERDSVLLKKLYNHKLISTSVFPNLGIKIEKP